MHAIAMEKGVDFYETPFHVWLSISLLEVQKRGGHVENLAEYQKQKEACEDDIMKRLEEYQNSEN